MPRQRTRARVHNVTDKIDVSFGMFDLSASFRIPFMTSLLRFQQVAEYLNLVTDDHRYAKQDWDVEELFQREVSKGRVITLVEQYLKSDTRPQFFNSLTIVLKAHEAPLAGAYSPPQPDSHFPKHVSIGPIVISYDHNSPNGPYPQPLPHGTLLWNRDEVYAVAIDGQHRLAAIRDLPSDLCRASSLSVIFLVLAPEMGFHSPATMDTMGTMRSIFVDLNKRAEPVSRARNLLLDDIDPRAQFVRRLFGPSLSYTVDPVGGSQPLGFPVGVNAEFDSRIPPVLARISHTVPA